MSTKIALTLLLSVSSWSLAQDETPLKITNQNRSGDLPFSLSIGTEVEHVDVSSGTLTVKIPVASFKGRGMDFSYGLRFTSGFWVTAVRQYPNTPSYQQFAFELRNGVVAGPGWETTEPYLTWINAKGSCGTYEVGGRWLGTGEPVSYFQEHSHYLYHDEGGGKHLLAVRAGSGLCDNGGYTIQDFNGPDLSGAGMHATIAEISTTPAVILSNGAQTAWPQTSGGYGISSNVPYNYIGNLMVLGRNEDSNGNTLTSSPGGQDTLGRVLLTSNVTANPFTYTIKDANGIDRTYSVNIGSLSYSTTFNATGPYGAIVEATGTTTVINSIVLPNGQQYSFQYESGSFLGLTRIDLPTGGYITYGWSTLADQDHPQRYVSSRDVHVGGQTYTWTISRTCQATAGDPCDQIQTTVTDPLNNQTAYVTKSGAIAQARVYAGSATGTPLRQYDVTYDSYDDPINDQPEARDMRKVTTTLENGIVSEKQFDPEPPTSYSWQDCDSGDLNQCAYLQANNQITYTNYTTTRGNVAEMREYDYGQGTPGALIKRVSSSYLHATNSTYLNANIVDKITKIEVFDAAGVSKAKTLFDYDNNGQSTLVDNNGVSISSYPVNTPSVPGHDYSKYSTSNLVRGNVTHVKKWLTDTTYLTTIYGYDDLGNILTVTDPRNYRTTYSYVDNWPAGSSACLPASDSRAFVTTVTNALNQQINVKRYPCTGAVQSHQNANDIANSRAGTSYTFDLMGRPSTQSFSDGGFSSVTYNDFSLPLSSTTTQKLRSDNTGPLVTTSIVDDLGRVKQAQLTSDPQGTAFVDTTYDALGRVATVTNPYRSTSDGTYGVTKNVYDALGRLCKAVPADNVSDTATSCSSTVNTASTFYSGNSTTVTDPAGKQRRSFSDALGRLVEVDEPGLIPSGGSAGTPATGSTGSVTWSGTEQNAIVQTQNASPGRGSVTISGTEQSTFDPDIICPNTNPNCSTIWDTGTVQIAVNGLSKTVTYGQNSTSVGLASSLASAFNSDATSAVTAAVSGSAITFTAKQSGTATNYSLSSSSATSKPTWFSNASFVTTPSGNALTGGVNAVTSTVYDTGNATITVGSSTKSVSWGQNSTTASIASALASAFNGDAAAPVSASSSSGTVSFSSKTSGAATNYSLSSSRSYDSSHFSSSSFSSSNSAATMTGGTDGTPAVPATNTWSLSTPYITKYVYDVLGNPNCVEQQGNVTGTGCSSPESSDALSAWRVRRFTYDALSRLITSKNPETGKVCYGIWSGSSCINGYDPNGNLLKKTDARNITTTYAYDALDRLTDKTYSNNDPAIHYGFDASSILGTSADNGIGRRTSMTDASGSSAWNYDSMGRVLTSRKTFTGLGLKNIATSYNPDGSVQSITYPSGMVVSYAYDAAGRLVSAIDGAGNKYLSAATYWPHGALMAGKRGQSATYAGIDLDDKYNSRLQPIWLKATNAAGTALLSLSYDFGFGAADNGNVLGITNNRNSARSAAFTYDGLNRIAAAYTPNANTWGNTFSIDAWGNLNKMLPYLTMPLAQNFDQTSNSLNRIVDFCYDAAGNYNALSNCAGGYPYDAESRITQAAGVAYTYDGDGVRVKKLNGTLYWGASFTAGPIAESDLGGTIQREFIFVNGKRIARRDASGAIHYYFADHLGSSDVVTSATGMIEEESDYYPYGGERVITDTLGDQNYKFTAKERDAESGLDYFGARYYSSNMGRWMSPDPKAPSRKTLFNPQKWNKYNYVLNNPLSNIDPDGLEEITIQLRAYIPQANVGPYRGDNRGPTASQNVTSRTSITLRIETDPKISANPLLSNSGGQAGTTHNDLTGNTATQTQGLPNAQVSRDANGNVVINVKQDVANPLAPSPGIRSDVTIGVPVSGSSVTTSGTVSGSPAFEVNVGTPGNDTTNVPLQGAASNPVSFAVGLYQTNQLPQTTKPLPPPRCTPGQAGCSQ